MNTTSGLTAVIVETGSPFVLGGFVNSQLFSLVMGRARSLPVIEASRADAMQDSESVTYGGSDLPIEQSGSGVMAASTLAKLKILQEACPVVAFCVTT